MAVEPTPAQFEEVAAAARAPAGPLVMLNLNRYRDREAYLKYAEVATGVLERVGGRVLWRASVQMAVIGDEGDAYDEVIAVWYPSVAAFVELASDPQVGEARVHRLAGLERATLLCCESGPEPVLSGL